MTDHRKMVLLEAAELNRIRQRQIREYDPNISAMARAQEQIEDILLNDKLSNEEKMALINHARDRYESIKNTVGPIGNTAAAAAAINPPVTTTAAPTIPTQSHKVADAKTTTSMSKAEVDKEGVASDYHVLKYLVSKNPKLIRSNKNGELVINNRTIRGSNYEDVFNALVTGNDIENTHGVSEFVNALHILNPSKKMFRSETLANNLFQSSPIVKSQPSSVSNIKSSPSTPTLSPANPSIHSSPLSTSKPKSKPKTRSQKGRGFTDLTPPPPPPGKRPKILRLYR